MLDERFRYRKLVQLYKFGKDLFPLQLLLPVIALVLEAFRDFLFVFVQSCGVAHILRKLIVQIRELFVFDAEHLDGIVVGFPGELGIGIIGGIGDLEIFVLADIRAAQVLVEGLHGFFGADVAENAIRLQRFAAARRSPHQFQLHIVAVFDGPPFDGSKRRGAFAHLLESLRDVGLVEFHRGHLDCETFVIAKLELREDFEYGAKLQRLAFGKIQFFHLWLRNRSQFLFRDGFFNALRDERLQHFALDVFREAAADQRYRCLARPKSRHAGNAREFLSYTLDLFRYFFRGNLQIQLAAAGCFSHGTIFSSVNDLATNRSW